MSESEKRSSVGFWATAILLLLPVLYVLSSGPAIILADRGVLPRPLWFYKPLHVIWVRGPLPAAVVLNWYWSQFAPSQVPNYKRWPEAELKDEP